MIGPLVEAGDQTQPKRSIEGAPASFPNPTSTDECAP